MYSFHPGKLFVKYFARKIECYFGEVSECVSCDVCCLWYGLKDVVFEVCLSVDKWVVTLVMARAVCIVSD